MRIIFIGCVESSRVFLRETLTVENADVVGIITKSSSTFNSDFISLKDIAEENNIPFIFKEEYTEEEIISWIKKLNADIIYCFGWSHLLSLEVIRSTKLGGIGYHPAKLPSNRGRHPLIWALALGLDETASTFFFLDLEADSGDIISQEDIPILENDDATSMYDKLMQIGRKQVKQFTQELIAGNYKRIKQDNSKSNVWRKRSRKDGIIDWRMPARGIYNLIRALTHPYVGASFIYKDQEIKVWRSEVIVDQSSTKNLEPGRVLSAENNSLEVQCGIGIIRLLDMNNILIKKGECLL